MKRKIRRRFVTLVEMMIVMFLIALITGVVAYNYRASLEKGRVFASEQGVERVRQILEISVAENPDVMDTISGGHWQDVAKSSPLFNDKLLKDGWGYDYQVSVNNGAIDVQSQGLNAYYQAHPEVKH